MKKGINKNAALMRKMIKEKKKKSAQQDSKGHWLHKDGSFWPGKTTKKNK